MQESEIRAVLAIAMLAALADERKDSDEQTHIAQVAERLGAESGLTLSRLHQDVLLGRLTLDSACAALTSDTSRELAFEAAVGVCDADGLTNEAESRFLRALGEALGLAAARTRDRIDEAEALATLPLATDGPAPAAATADPAGLDEMILKASLLNGALELLPQSLASMAILPLQTRLVYRIGKAYGFELDRGHIKDFLATLGVGLTSQYVETFGRKLIGGLLGSVMGKTGKAIGSAATGAGFSFASTYALGQVARRYYAGGRRLDGQALKAAFNDTLGQARTLQSRYQPEMAQQAKTLDLGTLMREIRH